jgi:phage shock protein A
MSNIFSRMQTIISSNINALLDGAEDPEKMINQTLLEMQEGLRETKIAVARAIRDKKMLEDKYDETVKQTDYWEEKAIIAVEKGDDNLAKEALKRKKEQGDAASDLKTQLETMTKNVDALKSSCAALESKMEEAKRKKEILLARLKNAETSKKINENVGKFNANSTSAFETFDRMEKQVNYAEAEAEAVQELSDPDIDVKKKFEELETNDKVDSELEALKKRLGKS